MKLAEILKYLEQLVPGSVSKADLGNIPILSGTNLNNPLLYQMIRSVDEFKECELKILGQPTKKSKTMLVREGLKLKGNVHLWNITLTPSVFSFKDITTPVKNDSLITPLTYSPEEFIAYKSIVMRYNTETLQDRTKLVPTDADNEFRLTLHQRLDDILKHPEQYESKGHKGIMIRGEFEDYELPEGTNPVELYL